MRQPERMNQRLAAIFFVGCLLVNYPILSLFSRKGIVFGVPILYVYIFTAWVLLVGLLALAAEH